MINKTILVGNLGRDADVRYTTDGQAVANLSLATNEQWTDANGERQRRTEWHRVVIFGKIAEAAGNLYKKGKQLYIEGRLQTRRWEDQNGIERFTTEVVAYVSRLLGPAPEGANPPHPAEQVKPADRTKQVAHANQAIMDEFDDDDIPF